MMFTEIDLWHILARMQFALTITNSVKMKWAVKLNDIYHKPQEMYTSDTYPKISN